MASECVLERTSENKVFLRSSQFDDETYVFSDRPLRVADTWYTADFVTNFETVFSSETGGKPNAAFTFVAADTDTFEGPLIAFMIAAAFIAANDDDKLELVYELEQSPDQELVHPFGDFFDTDPGYATTEFVDCSLFIDSVAPRGYIEYLDSKYNIKCDPECAAQQFHDRTCNCGDIARVNNEAYLDRCDGCMRYSSNDPTWCDPRHGDPDPSGRGSSACNEKKDNGEHCSSHWECKGGDCSYGLCGT